MTIIGYYMIILIGLFQPSSIEEGNDIFQNGMNPLQK
jgi:hypothetical protein